MNEIHIKLDTSDAAMVGGMGWVQYDPLASVTEFVWLVTRAIRVEYPDCKITVSCDTNAYRNEIEVISDDKIDCNYIINEIVGNIWSNMNWLRV